jgi:hypothetical protein
LVPQSAKPNARKRRPAMRKAAGNEKRRPVHGVAP